MGRPQCQRKTLNAKVIKSCVLCHLGTFSLFLFPSFPQDCVSVWFMAPVCICPRISDSSLLHLPGDTAYVIYCLKLPASFCFFSLCTNGILESSLQVLVGPKEVWRSRKSSSLPSLQTLKLFTSIHYIHFNLFVHVYPF